MKRKIPDHFFKNIIAPNCNNDPLVINAFRKIPRSMFIDEAISTQAYADDALPIGFQQTISKPSTVALMTYSLNLSPQDVVLEIGTGSGYQTAILSILSKFVYTVERIPQLYNNTSTRLRKLFINNVKYKIGNGADGWDEYSPFDHIIITAGITHLPTQLLTQLKTGGSMLLPLNDCITKLTKTPDEIEEKKIRYCKFVDFIID